MLVGEFVSESLGLLEPEVAESGIDSLVDVVDVPLRLSMTDENELHTLFTLPEALGGASGRQVLAGYLLLAKLKARAASDVKLNSTDRSPNGAAGSTLNMVLKRDGSLVSGGPYG